MAPRRLLQIFVCGILWFVFFFSSEVEPAMINCAAAVLRGALTLPMAAHTDAGRGGGA